MELRRSPVQLPAHSRTTSEVRPPVTQCFVQLGLENLQGWRLHSRSGADCFTAGLFSRRKTFPYIQPEHFFSQFLLTVCPACLDLSE